MKKAQIFCLLILLLSSLLAESKPKSNLKKISSSKKNQLKKEIGKKLHPKEYYDDLVEKGLKADNLTRGHPPYPFYEKMNFTEDKKRRRDIIASFRKKETKRRLANDHQTLENLGFMSLVQDKTSSASNKVMKFIKNALENRKKWFNSELVFYIAVFF